MTTIHEWLAQQSVLLWPSVADHLWQATLFALIVFVAALALRRAPARVRHSFWLLASAKFIVPSALLVFLVKQANVDLLWLFGGQQNALLLQGITEPVSLIANSFEVTVTATNSVQHNEIYCVLTAVWLIGFLVLLVVWGVRRGKFLRVLKLGRSVNAGREWRALRRAQESLGVQTQVRLVVSPHKTEPTVCRVWKPVVMLPESIAEHLDDNELEAIMLHELVHIQRRDNLVGNLQMIMCALLWFHPLVWFISRKLFDEREQACDEKVLEIYDAPKTYASSILKVVRFCLGWNVAGVTGAGSGSNLRRRIDNIMSTNSRKRSAACSLLLASAVVVLVFAVMIAGSLTSNAGRASVAVRAMESQSDPLLTAGPVAEQTAPAEKKARLSQPTQPSQPSQIAQPSQDVQPSRPSQPAQESQPNRPSQPAQESQPSNESQPSQPAQPKATTSPLSPAAPTVDTQEKTKEKVEKKDKEVVKGELIEAPRPVYPEEARKQKIEGTVTVSIVIGEEGTVISARAKSGPEALHAASVEAAYKARFKPTTVDGKPVKVAGAMTYNFVVDDN